MPQEKLDDVIESLEEELLESLKKTKELKASIRKNKITRITNRLLNPYRQFKIKVSIAKYDVMMEKIEKKRQREIKRAEELEQKMREEARLLRIKDFNTAIRDKRKENIVNFVDDKKDKLNNIVDSVKDIKSSVVTNGSSFVINVKNEVLDKVRENTTIDLKIQNAIEDLKLKKAYKEYDKAYEENKKRDEQYFIDKAVPFANISSIVSNAKKEKCYLGRASKRAVLYFKNKVNNKAFDISSKISKSKSKIIIVFNNQLDKLNNKANEFVDRKLDAMKKDDAITPLERKDKINILRTVKENELAVKRAQLESMREAVEAINQSGDIFSNSTPLISTSRVK